MDEVNNKEAAFMSDKALQALANVMFSRGKVESLKDTIEQTGDRICDAIKDSVAIKDEYGNSLLSIGTQNIPEKFTTYGFSNDTLNWMLWLALYNDSWVFRRAIDKPAQDEVRCAIEFADDFKEKKDVLRIVKQHKFDFIQLLQWGALFGGSVAVCMFDKLEDADYEHSMAKNIGKVKNSSKMRLYITDRWYGCAPDYDDIVDNMKSVDYLKPRYYRITFADGHSIKVHHDYILRYEHRTAPKLVKQGMLQGWGYAEGAHILNEMLRDDKLKASVQSLVDKALIEVIKMSGMRGVFLGADKENQQQLEKRLEMVTWGRNFNSLTFLDKDDEYQEHGFSGLAGLADLLAQNMWLIAAALEMQGVLFGDLKQGFSNDAEALERYNETILGRCDSYVRPIYEKFFWIIFKWKGIKRKIEFEFGSLPTVVKKENEDKMQAIQRFQQLLSAMMTDGVIDAPQYAKALQEYVSKGTVNFGIDDKQIEKLKQNTVEESEDFDLEGDEENEV